MRLLVVTQVVDDRDTYLSFFTGWLGAFSGAFDSIEVICLKGGAYQLPKNVRVYSLGKESGAGRFTYIARFFSYAWRLRGQYDAVFVHMNQEYVLLGGALFMLLGKPVYLWRNHYAGSWMTALAERMCRKVFYTSKSSFTARFGNAVRMPVGVDLARFTPGANVPRTILSLGRFAPSKRPGVLVSALSLLKDRGTAFTATIVGSALPQDEEYAASVRAQGAALQSALAFKEGVPSAQTPAIFSAHELFIDLGSSGMYNKTIFEAAASGCIVLAASKDFQDEMGEAFGVREDDAAEIASKLDAALNLSDAEKTSARSRLREYTERNSLDALVRRLAAELS